MNNLICIIKKTACSVQATILIWLSYYSLIIIVSKEKERNALQGVSLFSPPRYIISQITRPF